MLSGIDLGNGKSAAKRIEAEVSAKTKGKFEIWLDDLTKGRLIATIKVDATGGESVWKTFGKAIKNVSGQRDVFVKFTGGSDHNLFIKSLCFVK
jgi:hypothetical protein